eukprot:jgi/Botrbrau1/15263/Bobra.0382s0005.1
MDITPVLPEVVRHLDARDCALAACVSTAWNHACSHDALWQRHCERDLLLDQPLDPFNHPLPTFQAAYRAWQTDGQVAPYLSGQGWARAARFWRKFEGWAAEHFPRLLPSLREGASEEQLDEAEVRLEHKLPPTLRALYRIHDGQNMPPSAFLPRATFEITPTFGLGMFGGYRMYDHLVIMWMLSLDASVKVLLSRRAPFGAMADLWRHHFVMAASSGPGRKHLLVHLETGRLEFPDRMSMPLFPACPVEEGADASNDVFRWLEHYLGLLEGGFLPLRCLLSDEGEHVPEPSRDSTLVISPFSNKPPLMVEQVTRGVRVRVTAMFLPEFSVGWTNLAFTYSVRFYLLSEEEQRAAPRGVPFQPVTEVQLLRRHWVIRDADGDEHVVDGEAVVGHYPHLRMGGEEFRYQSCTQQGSKTGSMEGYFTFMEGSIQRPTSSEFRVICPRFQLNVPEWLL